MELTLQPHFSYPHQTLYNSDGVSVTAVVLTADANAENSANEITNVHYDVEHNGIIINLFLHRHNEKNAINPKMIKLLTQALDVIDSHPLLMNTNNKSLIITGLFLNASEREGKSCKFFCNGFDLEWILRAKKDDNFSVVSHFAQNFKSLILARILILPFRTIAVINGHCIGAGLFLALACDYRIMRTDRGYIQWPEAKLGMKLTKGFAELSKAKINMAVPQRQKERENSFTLDPNVLREGLLTSKKFSPSEAYQSGIIDAQYPINDLYHYAFKWAIDGLPKSGLSLDNFDPMTYSAMKMEMYTDAYRALKMETVEDMPYSRI